MTITLIVLVLTIALFIWGRVRSDIVALSALVVLILSGILTPAEARGHTSILCASMYDNSAME